MDETRTLSVLSRINTWWNGDPVPESLLQADYRRRDFHILKKKLSDQRQVLAIRGPRQVGKTTVCGQLIDWLLRDRDIDAKRVLYLNIENSQILSDPSTIIEDSLSVYEQNVLQESFRRNDHTLYVFIDEVQKVPDWASTIKYYTDTYDNIKFVVTGSVSTLIEQDASETLIGRIRPFVMLPLKFADFAEYHGVMSDVTDSSLSLRTELKKAVKSGRTEELNTALTRFYGMNDDAVPELASLKDEYLLKGGYPGVIDEEYVEAYSSLDTDLRYTVTGDLASVFGVKKPEKVLRVLSLIADSTGGKLNVESVARSTGVSRDTVERYIDHLQEFFLVDTCPAYTTSEYRSGGQDKMYVSDVGHLNTLWGTLAADTLTDPETMGALLETATSDHARRLQFFLSDHNDAEVAYWDKRGEVDFVLSGTEYTLPIEVKNGDSTTKDLRGLERFLEDTDAPFGVVVNDAGRLVDDGDIVHIPSWLFFLMV